MPDEIQTQSVSPPNDDGESPRLGNPVWIGVGLLLLVGIGLALWFATQSGNLETRAEIGRVIESEEEFSLAGDVAVVLALQDTADDAWIQARALLVHDRLPAPRPVPVAQLAPDTLAVAAIETLDETHVRAEVRREYSRTAGEAAGGAESAPFGLFQFYRLDDQIGWVRTAPPESFWGALLLWSGDHVRAVHHQQDEALLNAIMPEVDALAGQACELWGDCPDEATSALFLTSSPAVFLDDPTTNTHVVLDTLGLTVEGVDTDAAYLHVASPNLAGFPLDSTGRGWLVEAYAVRVIADLAEQLAGPGPMAAARYAQALAELALDTADPGLRFEVAPTAAPTVEPTEPVLTATPSPPPTPALQTYVVQPGDTLIRIAERFNTTVEVILAFNNIANADDIRAGQELIIPPPDAHTPTPTPSAPPPPSATPVPAGTLVEYVVQEGDTLVGIATFYETTVEAIAAENGLGDEDAIFAGQQLRVPVGLARDGG